MTHLPRPRSAMNPFVELQQKISYASTPAEKLMLVSRMRSMVSEESNFDAAIDLACQAGLVPFLLDELRQQQSPEIVLESIWTLTNICTGNTEHTRHVVQSGAIPVLVHYASHRDSRIREQSSWALGNIAGDSKDLRNEVISSGALAPIASQCNLREPESVITTASWTLSNLSRENPSQADYIERVVTTPVLLKLLTHPNREVLGNTLWTLVFLTEGSQSLCKNLAMTDLRGLVNGIAEIETRLSGPTVKILGNVAACGPAEKDAILRSGVLQSPLFLGNTSPASRRQAVTFLHQLTQNAPPHVLQAVSNSSAIEALNSAFLSSTSLAMAKEVAARLGLAYSA